MFTTDRKWQRATPMPMGNNSNCRFAQKQHILVFGSIARLRTTSCRELRHEHTISIVPRVPSHGIVAERISRATSRKVISRVAIHG